MMTLDVGDAVRQLGSGSSGPRLNAVQRNEERRMMSAQELAEMPLESLLYYVLVGDGRRSL